MRRVSRSFRRVRTSSSARSRRVRVRRGRPATSLSDAARALIDGATSAGVRRLIVVGGAGSLEVAPGVRLVDTPGFPAEYKSESLDQADVARRLSHCRR